MRGVSLLLASLLFCVVAENLLTVQQQQQITVAINDVRFRLEPAGNLPMLKVDDAIAAKAESWTSQCTFKPDRKLKHLYGTAYLNASKVLSATELVDGWGSEATSISSFISEEFDNARNYRTLIYENATSIGCSMSKCGSTYFYGCLVSPKGDFPGVIPYNPTCTPKYPIDCAAKKSCGSYWDGCKKVVCGPICQSGTTPDNYTYATYGLGWGAVDKKRDSVSVVDWRTRGVVTPIKDQAQCGSCWAFAVTATVETQWAIYKNQLYTQSPQQYVSCSGAGSCGGGYAVTAFNYLNNHYAATESSYPYVSGDGSQPGCQDIGDTETIGTSGGSTRRITLNAASIEAALQKGPVATVIDVNTDFNYYKSGIFNTPCDGYTLGRHVIVIVGYGHDDDTGLDYWIIRNSWNTVWGESGYVRFRKGVNLCGVEGYELYQFIPRGFNFNDQNTGFTPTPYIPPPPPPSPPPPPPPSTPDYPQPNTPPPNGGSNTILNSDHIARILQMHNDNRASNCVAALEWDDGISSFAQDYSNNCVNQHNPNRGSYGENIAAAGGTGVNAPSIDRLINYWIDEKSQYQCGTVGSGSAGHWTQMMAAKTTRIGCGLSQCNNIGGGYDTWYLVCNYNPMGNDGTVAYDCPNDGCAPPPPTPTPPAPTPSPPTPPPPPPPSSPNGVPTPNGMTYGFQFLFSGVSSGSLDVGKVQSGICNIVGAGSCSGDMFGTSSAYDDGNGNTWYKFSFSGAYSGYGAALQSAVGANFGTVSSNTGYQCNSWQLSISS